MIDMNDLELVLFEAERKSKFRQLRRDMRVLARIMKRYENARPCTLEWRTAYSLKKDHVRKLKQRYPHEGVSRDEITWRMEQVVRRTYGLKKF